MKKIYYLLFLLLFGLVSCQKEDAPAPSFADQDRLPGLLDLSHPLVKYYKESYDVNILWNFNDTLDFKYVMEKESVKDQWAAFNISHMEGDSVVKENLKIFDAYVLQCFQDTLDAPVELGKTAVYYSDFKKKYFPHKILLADTVTTNGNKLCPDRILAEADVMKTTENTWYALWNGYEQLFACSEPQLRIKNDKLSTVQLGIKARMIYSLLVNIIDRHGLYKQIPEEFFAPCEELFNKDVKALAKAEYAVDTIRTDTDTTYRIPAEWYIDKGMALTDRSPIEGSACADLDYEKTLFFPTRERDVRNFLSVMICETSTSSSNPITKFYVKSEVFTQRMKVLVEALYGWGVDVFAINPAMKKFYK